MPDIPKNSPPQLPQPLLEQLSAVRRFLWRIKIGECLLSCISACLLLFLLFYGLERWAEMPLLIRLLFFAVLLFCILLALPWGLYHWLWRHRHLPQLARLIGKKFPSQGDRLLGVVELNPTTTPQHSATLAQAAMNQLSEELTPLPLHNAVPQKHFRQARIAAITLIIFSTILFLLTPESAINSWVRLTRPDKNITRFTFTQFNPLPQTLYVPLGESFKISLTLSPSSQNIPRYLNATLGKQQKREFPITHNSDKSITAKLSLPGIFDPQILQIQAGDTTIESTIIPIPRPTVSQLSAHITYPEYTGHAPEDILIKTGVFSLLKGGKLTLSAQSTSPLKSASEWINNVQPTQITLSPPEDKNITFKEQTVTSPYEQNFIWTNIHHIEAEQPFTLIITPINDQSPETYLHAPDKELFILDSEIIPLTLSSSDDYGLKNIGITWQGTTNKTIHPLAQGTRTQTHLEQEFSFRPADWNLAPQQIILRAYVNDYYPQGNEQYSEKITINILDKNSHAQMIRAALSKITIEIEDSAQREQIALDETNLTLDQPKDSLSLPETQQKIEQLAQSQTLNKERLNKTLKKLDDLFGKAIRNDQISTEALQQYYHAQSLLAPLPEGSQESAQNALTQAQEKTNTPEKTKELLSKAKEHLEHSTQQLNNAIADLIQSSHKIEAGTFAARLQQISQDENQLAEALLTTLSETLGLIPSQLTITQEQSRQQYQHIQSVLNETIEWINEDLHHFFLRSKVDIYGNVSQALQSLLAQQNKEFLLKSIRTNQSTLAIDEALFLSEKFKQWANIIEGTDSKDASQAGKTNHSGEDKTPSERDIDFMMKLMKTLQIEQDIRTRTRQFHKTQSSISPEQQDKRLNNIIEDQDNLQADLQEIAAQQTDKDTINLLNICQDTMNEVLDKLEIKETGTPTIAAQTDVIERIYQTARQKAEGSPDSAGLQGLLHMMQGAMGNNNASPQKATQQGSPSSKTIKGTKPLGGKTSSPSNPSTQEPKGIRILPKFSGSAGIELPQEFQKAMDAYTNESATDASQTENNVHAPKTASPSPTPETP